MNAPANLTDELAFRASVVGASEVAALFDESPYLTHFELWHRKKGTIDTPEFDAIGADGTPENERIYWGVRLEAAIIEAAKDRYGYTDREQVDRLTNGRGLGGHPDRRVICPTRGPGILEVKTVDWLQRRSWGEEPPLHYLLQNIAYQGLDGVTWGDVIVLVGGNKLERFQYEFRPKVYAEIERRVDAFWQSIEADRAPSPDYQRDGETLATIYRDIGLEKIDLAGDNLAAAAAAEYQAASADESAAKKRKDAAKAELIHKIGSAAGTAGELPPAKRVLATLPGFTVSATLIDEIPDRAAEPGEIIKGRSAYRRLTLKETNDGK